MPNKLYKWLILIGLLAYAVLVSAWAGSHVRGLYCTGIDVDILPAAEGAHNFLKPEAVLNELGALAHDYSSTPLWSIDTDSLERSLNRVNNFEHVEVVRTTSGKLLITVLPMVPEARIYTPAGSYYINKEGKRMDAKADFYVNLPVVRGNFTNSMPAVGVLPVVRYIRNDSFLSDLVTMIDYKSPENILLVPRIRGHVVNLGDTTDLPEKFAKLMLMYRKVMPHKGWNTYDTISVKFKGQIVATRADKSMRRHNNVDDSLEEDIEDAAVQADLVETEAIKAENTAVNRATDSGSDRHSDPKTN